ncbi:hypothetical protein IQ06DRAFT_297234 [Phaeosphaeriaceae sp. SRC1lsM3a]|nr:hypothetical protein IQ06DRAFT_297234 [Stagonospora sp. SRC1lsM3a]
MAQAHTPAQAQAAQYGSAQASIPISQDAQSTDQHLDNEGRLVPTHVPDSPVQYFDDPTGLHLRVDFAWSKFKNIISVMNGDQQTPVYIQHFRPLKPQLRIENASDNTSVATGTINTFSISAECSVNGRTIDLKPVKRWKTHYNYLSTTLSADPATPTAINWITNCSLKIWDFVCLDANQIAIAKFSVNWWAVKQVGNFYFEKPAQHVSKEARDEIVATGLTLLYVMTTRINNPLNIVGSVFGKTAKVEEEARKDI